MLGSWLPWDRLLSGLWVQLASVGLQNGSLHYSGIVLTTSGIAWVLLDRPDSTVDLSHLRAGICWAVVAALSHATGAVLSRTVYEQSTLTPLWATFFRFLVGQTALLIWLAVNLGKSLDLKPFRSLRFVSLSKSDPAQGRSL
jgi:drug/metabolite transporter (DMT)-like permease